MLSTAAPSLPRSNGSITVPNRLLIIGHGSGTTGISAIGTRLGYAVNQIGTRDDFALAFLETAPTLLLLQLTGTAVGALETLHRIVHTRYCVPIILISQCDALTTRAAYRFAADTGLELGDMLAWPLDAPALTYILLRYRRSVPACATTDLRHAIRRGEVDGRFQPCVATANGHAHLVGAELIARWTLRTGTTLRAGEFAGLTADPQTDWTLFHHMLWLARQAQHEWHAAGITVPVMLDFSARFLAGGFATGFFESWIARAAHRFPVALKLHARDLDARQLPDHARLAQLRRSGYRIAIEADADDLWSMRDVGRWPVDEIVLSASLTQSLPASRARRCMVNALLRAARPANIAVRATGIQTREVLETATDLGVSRLQGDLVGPAVERQKLLAPRPLQQALHS